MIAWSNLSPIGYFRGFSIAVCTILSGVYSRCVCGVSMINELFRIFEADISNNKALALNLSSSRCQSGPLVHFPTKESELYPISPRMTLTKALVEAVSSKPVVAFTIVQSYHCQCQPVRNTQIWLVRMDLGSTCLSLAFCPAPLVYSSSRVRFPQHHRVILYS
jgi:hypothetical protein